MMEAEARLECGMMFFSASAESTETDKYAVVVEAAKYGDRHGFSSIWVPERHFTLLGGLYPNPSVLQAALAMVTERIQLRAGSVVLPLHNPLRVAEEWAMVDNLSRGRVGISFASGWNPADFTFFPDRYEGRQDALFEAIPIVQRLWQGEKISVKGGAGQEADVAIFPRPIQKSLPTWLTAAGNPQTYERVGASGANLLTHLLDQGTEALASKIALYRNARAAHGHDPQTGQVSLMIHTFLASDAQEAKELARRPFCDFLKLNAGLLNGLAKARGGRDMDYSKLSPADQEEFVQFIYERFVGSRAFIGSPESCLSLARDLHAAGVDELLFLLDFGPSYRDIVAGLPHLARLKELCASSEHIPARDGARGAAAPISPPQVEEGLEQVRSRCHASIEILAPLEQRGIPLDGVGVLQSLASVHGEALAQLSWPAHAESDAVRQALLVELCAQLSLGAAGLLGPEAPLCIPTAVQTLDARRLLSGQVWVCAKVDAKPAANARFAARIRLFGDGGEIVGEGRIELERLSTPIGVAAIAEAAHAGQCLHAVEWQRHTLAGAAVEPSSWLILTDDQGVGQELVDRLTQRGDRCSILRRPHLSAGGSRHEASLADELAGFRAALRELAKDPLPLRGVVHLWSLDATPNDATTPASLEQDTQHLLGSVVALIRVLGDAEVGSAKLWLVTRGAQRVEQAGDGAPAAFTQAPVWGLGQAFLAEHRQLFGALVDLDSQGSTGAAAALLSVLDQVQDAAIEDMVAFRAAEAWVPRLVPRHAELTGKIELREDASYLITGGFGGIGQVTAEWLVERGAKHVILLGRQGLPPRDTWDDTRTGRWTSSIALIRRLEAAGATVSVAAIDVGEEGTLASFLQAHQNAGLPAIRGVFHTAGTLHPKRLAELELSDLRQAFQSKVQGSWQLQQAFGTDALDLFVTFSSAPPHLGVLGQSLAAYNAANSFMDALVDYRVAKGLPGLNIKWGPWAEVGLHTVEGAAKSNLERLAAFGLRSISNQEGMRILEHLLSERVHQRWALAADWPKLFESDFLISGRPFFSAVSAAATDLDEGARLQRHRAEFVAQLGSLSPKARQQRLVAQLRELVAQVMRLDPQVVDWRRGLFDMGMDSLMALELKTKLQNRVGLSISATLAFDYPTVDAIAGYLESQLFASVARVAESAAEVAVLAPAMTEQQLNALNESELEAALLAKLEAL